MNLGIQGHTAVIVGSARGIGNAIAREFAREGANVALVDREAAVSDAASAIAREFGVKASALTADVTNFEAMKSAADRIASESGRIDHLVFAVGIGSGKFGFPFWNLEPSDWPRVMNVNVQGAVNVVHAFTPSFLKAKAGSMLLIASVAGQMGSQTDPPYSASKAANINFAQCLAKDLAPHGIRVNTVCPGMVQTPLNEAVWRAWRDQQPEDQRLSYLDWAAAKIHAVVPLGQWQRPEDIADMIVFLSSTRAAQVTGQTINVDGGFVMHW